MRFKEPQIQAFLLPSPLRERGWGERGNSLKFHLPQPLIIGGEGRKTTVFLCQFLCFSLRAKIIYRYCLEITPINNVHNILKEQ